MGLKLVEAPQMEPVSLEEAKAHLRMESTNAEDAYIGALISAARERVELFLRRALITQTYSSRSMPSRGTSTFFIRAPISTCRARRCNPWSG